MVTQQTQQQQQSVMRDVTVVVNEEQAFISPVGRDSQLGS